jgi:hypothetical protein
MTPWPLPAPGEVTPGLTKDGLACDCASVGRLKDVAAAFVVSEALLCQIAAAVIVQTVRIAANLGRSYL